MSWVYLKCIFMKYLFIAVGPLMCITESLLEILLMVPFITSCTRADTKKHPDTLRRKPLVLKVRAMHQTAHLPNSSSVMF